MGSQMYDRYCERVGKREQSLQRDFTVSRRAGLKRALDFKELEGLRAPRGFA